MYVKSGEEKCVFHLSFVISQVICRTEAIKIRKQDLGFQGALKCMMIFRFQTYCNIKCYKIQFITFDQTCIFILSYHSWFNIYFWFWQILCPLPNVCFYLVSLRLSIASWSLSGHRAFKKTNKSTNSARPQPPPWPNAWPQQTSTNYKPIHKHDVMLVPSKLS